MPTDLRHCSDRSIVVPRGGLLSACSAGAWLPCLRATARTMSRPSQGAAGTSGAAERSASPCTGAAVMPNAPVSTAAGALVPRAAAITSAARETSAPLAPACSARERARLARTRVPTKTRSPAALGASAIGPQRATPGAAEPPGNPFAARKTATAFRSVAARSAETVRGTAQGARTGDPACCRAEADALLAGRALPESGDPAHRNRGQGRQ